MVGQNKKGENESPPFFLHCGCDSYFAGAAGAVVSSFVSVVFVVVVFVVLALCMVTAGGHHLAILLRVLHPDFVAGLRLALHLSV